MNPHLQSILSFIEKSDGLTAEQKSVLLKNLKDADKELEITAFKLDRTEKVKRTTAILLEETIEELEQKRKAVEAQNRELEMESSLERVRTAAMGMKKPDDLLRICEIVFIELKTLGFHEIRNAMINTFEDHNEYFLDHDFSDYTGGKISRIPTKGDQTVERFLIGIRQSGDAFIELKVHGAELESWKRYRKETRQLEDDRIEGAEALYYYYYSTGNGSLGISTFAPVSAEKREVLRKFRNVFDFAYRRYMDVTQAEAQAKEAIKRASLDRVRAEIASMRTSGDLEKIIPLIWNELTILKVPFIRCGVFIMDESRKEVQTLLSTPEGKAIASFQLPFNDTEPLPQLVPHWRRGEIYKQQWDESDFIRSSQIMMQRGAIASSEQYISGRLPTSLHLHFLPFEQGMLYVGSEAPLAEDEILLIQDLADAFSTAYARYEDFNKLEAANNKIEKALLDLRQTQAQLIQAEKMASLGELTAGIAHEIQNPLNFVNNFSEINKELLDEIQEARKKGPGASGGERNDILESELIKSIKENEEKIMYHGRRADAIVKSMLQHSRTIDQSGKNRKEPTDINALAEEYLRLAYHGLRAKDQAFNSSMHTDFDESIGRIETVSQEMARVILNLVTNAFQAVQEQQKRKKEKGENYSPEVSLTTKKRETGIEIRVKDNGPGIPEHLVDKIFQPFFTTKPTGQGTGLGLSLAYDIVKAHGGDIKVVTKPGEETEFIIKLPS